MINTEIVNARIENWWLRKNENDIVELDLELKLNSGNCVLPVYPGDMDKLFNVLKIKDIRELKGAACIALLYDRCVKTIGDFLFISAAEWYTNINKIKEHDEKYWLNYDIFLKYNDKY